MSLFIGNVNQYSYAKVDPAKIAAAQLQYEAMSATFNRLLISCQEKCILPEYGESDLNTGEQSCIDRCVSKYVKSNLVVGKAFQNLYFDATRDMQEYRIIQRELAKNERNGR